MATRERRRLTLIPDRQVKSKSEGEASASPLVQPAAISLLDCVTASLLHSLPGLGRCARYLYPRGTQALHQPTQHRMAAADVSLRSEAGRAKGAGGGRRTCSEGQGGMEGPPREGALSLT
jgi:hypothetical protein